MTSLSGLLAWARTELPEGAAARWASVFLSLSVLTFLVSLAASQAFLGVAGFIYALDLVRHPARPGFPPVKLPLALFALTTVVSVGWAENPTIGWLAVRKLVLFVILLLSVNLVVSGKHLAFLYKALFAESAVAGVVAAGQFVAQYREVRAEHPSQIYHYMTLTRIHGFMGHWMVFGGQQMLVFIALLAFLLAASKNRLGRASQAPLETRGTFWWLMFGIISISIVLNFTRGVWLGCFIATIYLVARWRARWLVALLVCATAIYLAAPSLVRQRLNSLRHPSADPSLSIRFEMWRTGLNMIRRHPLVGVGAGNVNEVYTLYLPAGTQPEIGYHEHLHNDCLQLAAERGLPCLAAWVWFMGALGWHFWRIRRRLIRHRASAWIADAAIAVWLAFLAEGFFEFNFGTSPVLMLFLFVASTPFVAENFLRAENRQFEAAPDFQPSGLRL